MPQRSQFDSRAAIEAVPDPSPSPAEIVAGIDDAEVLAALPSGGEMCRRFALLILSFPQELAHALCRMIIGQEVDASVAAIARQCGIPRSTARRYINRARLAYARFYVPPRSGTPAPSQAVDEGGVVTPPPTGPVECDDGRECAAGGGARRETNARKAMKTKGKEQKRGARPQGCAPLRAGTP